LRETRRTRRGAARHQHPRPTCGGDCVSLGHALAARGKGDEDNLVLSGSHVSSVVLADVKGHAWTVRGEGAWAQRSRNRRSRGIRRRGKCVVEMATFGP
jgi:hypothetical protein